MKDSRLKVEIAQWTLSDLDTHPLYFDSPTTRTIKPGSKCSLRCLGGTYNLRRGWVLFPQ
jgi:hypothetical protein